MHLELKEPLSGSLAMQEAAAIPPLSHGRGDKCRPFRCVEDRKSWGKNIRIEAQFTQDAEAHLRINFHASPLMLHANCVNTPIDCSVFKICVRLLRGVLRPV